MSDDASVGTESAASAAASDGVGLADDVLIPILAEYLPHQRWFSAKGQELGTIEIIGRAVAARDLHGSDIEQVLFTVDTLFGNLPNRVSTVNSTCSMSEPCRSLAATARPMISMVPSSCPLAENQRWWGRYSARMGISTSSARPTPSDAAADAADSVPTDASSLIWSHHLPTPVMSSQ